MTCILSPDGVRIGYQRSGTGLPLVLVHGVGGTAARWAPVLPALTQHFRVFALDRRGRGASGDAPSYAIEREVEDIVALVDSIGEPVNLLGHSFGAICALEATLCTSNLRKVVLYEPPVPLASVTIYPDGLIERLEALLAAGDREGVLTMFLREVVRMPDDAYQLFRSSPAWPGRVAAVHTLPREVRAHQAYLFDAARFCASARPTLLLLGGDSPSFFRASIEVIAAALPASRTVVLPGQQHTAMDTAPDLFAREVIAFLSEPESYDD
ncbi:MAG TPA: alpha/beta hydrolase [Roseiflexaceae bacterium]|nr:alpha/beta hydrolase [Roseiflexaceae bacterium]